MSLNVLLIALGSAGDVNPLLAVGRCLQARGHRVTLLTNGHFEPVVRRAGLDFVELGTDQEYRALIERPEIWNPVDGIRLLAEWGMLVPMRRTFALIHERNIPGATVVAAPFTALGARLAEEACGVPLVTLVLQPSLLRSAARPPRMPPLPLHRGMPRSWNRFWYWLADVALFDRLIGPGVNAFRAELGLAPVRGSLERWCFSTRRILGLFPDWFAPPPPDWRTHVRLTGFPFYDDPTALGAGDSADLGAFLEAGAPPIVFTPGSAMRHGRSFFAAVADACRRLGRRGVLVSPYRDQIPGGLPPEVRAVDSVPFSRLFPRAAAVVHHGGIGTMAQGFAAGVPQLIMPMAYDQHDNAARLETLGVGRSLPRHRFDGPRAARALESLLEGPGVADRCRALARRVRHGDPLEESCRLIEQAVAGQATP